MKTTSGILSGDASAQASQTWEAVIPKSFWCAQNFVVIRNICCKHVIKTKYLPLKMYFATQTLKPGYWPGSAKIVSAIRIFFEGHSASRCSIISKNFFINHR